MADPIGPNTNHLRIDRAGAVPRRSEPDRLRRGGASFDQLLQQKLQKGVRLSAHAATRLRESRIELSEADMERLSGAMAKAEAKGARESLILMDNLALVVSIKNRTVITAVTPERLKENVFTNIDSAVIT